MRFYDVYSIVHISVMISNQSSGLKMGCVIHFHHVNPKFLPFLFCQILVIHLLIIYQMEVIMLHSGDTVMKVKKVGKVPVFLEFAFYWHKSDLNR